MQCLHNVTLLPGAYTGMRTQEMVKRGSIYFFPFQRDSAPVRAWKPPENYRFTDPVLSPWKPPCVRLCILHYNIIYCTWGQGLAWKVTRISSGFPVNTNLKNPHKYFFRDLIVKELNCCHKQKFANPYIFATRWCKPLNLY